MPEVNDYVGIVEDYMTAVEDGDLSGFSGRHSEFLKGIDVNNQKVVLSHIRRGMERDLGSSGIEAVRRSLRHGRERYGEDMDPYGDDDLKGPYF